MLKKAILPLLLACSSVASAATYRLTYVSTIGYTQDLDEFTSTISTIYGNITEGSTISIQLTYDLDNLSKSATSVWPEGSEVVYSSTVATTATISISSGYSYSGPVSGANMDVMSFLNQPTFYDGVKFNDADGNDFMVFIDFSSSAFTTFPLPNDSLAQINADFITAVNNGTLELFNGGPTYYTLPGIGTRNVTMDFNTPSVINIAAVPEPSSLLLLSTGLLPLLRRRRAAR